MARLFAKISVTEFVKKGLEELSKRGVSTPLHIADIGTGSGAIAISLCASFPSKVLEVTATDISSQAIEVAKYNAKKLLTPDQLSRCAFFVSDLFSEYETRKPIDILFANLPYIPTDRLSHLDASVIDNEPDVALDGGPEGASHIRKLLIEAPKFLAPKATVFLEVDHTHTKEDLFKDPSKYEISFFKDDGGYRRFVHATYLG